MCYRDLNQVPARARQSLQTQIQALQHHKPAERGTVQSRALGAFIWKLQGLARDGLAERGAGGGGSGPSL